MASGIKVQTSCGATNSELMTMASHQLGPEQPRPFAVLSENHVRKSLDLPSIPEQERFSFGSQYDDAMCKLIDKNLGINTDDKVCYVGDPKGTFAPLIQSQFCLLEPVTTVVPGHIHYEESPSHKMLPFRVANVGAAEFFRTESTVPAQFDKVILIHSMQYIEEPKVTFEHAIKTMRETGTMLIIHRAAPMCTLPMFSEARERMLQYDQSYLTIIQNLQSIGCDVQWEIECLPIQMTKMRWMSMIKDKFPSQLEGISNHEIVAGLRELSEGVMKYTSDIIEFPDRLMFITAQRPLMDKYPTIGRIGTDASVTAQTKSYAKPKPTELHYQLKVTDEIARIIKEKESEKSRKLGMRDKYSGTRSTALP